jgi:hypothetical protein
LEIYFKIPDILKSSVSVPNINIATQYYSVLHVFRMDSSFGVIFHRSFTMLILLLYLQFNFCRAMPLKDTMSLVVVHYLAALHMLFFIWPFCIGYIVNNSWIMANMLIHTGIEWEYVLSFRNNIEFY